MQEPEQEYPLPQAGEDGHHQPLNGKPSPTPTSAREPQPTQEKPEPPQQGEETTPPQLPQGRLRNSLIAGVIMAFLCSAQAIVITLANAAIYQNASATPPGKLTVNLALAVLGLGGLTLLINMLILLIGGYITGRIVIQRRLVFLAGFIAGTITYVIGYVLRYIPSYPGNLPVSGTNNAAEVASGIVLSLISLLIAGGFAGLISLFGAWLATRRHPYYAR